MGVGGGGGVRRLGGWVGGGCPFWLEIDHGAVEEVSASARGETRASVASRLSRVGRVFLDVCLVLVRG